MSSSARLVTAEEFEHYHPGDDYRYELVAGRIIRMSPPAWRHGRIVTRMIALLHRHVQRHGLGAVVGEVGFKLASHPDTVRGPDISFVRQGRVADVRPDGFWSGSPDLVIEVLSPEDRSRQVREKVDEYLTAGVTVVVVVDPRRQTVAVHRRLLPPTVLQGDGTPFEVDDLIPGFSCTLAEIFQD